YHENGEQLFCENETNNERIYNYPSEYLYQKDGINNHVVEHLISSKATVNPELFGTKAAVWFQEDIPAGEERSFRIRLSRNRIYDPWSDFEHILETRKLECDEYY